jgi:hypothetical protein
VLPDQLNGLNFGFQLKENILLLQLLMAKLEKDQREV